MQAQVSALESDFYAAIQDIPDLSRRAAFVDKLKEAVARTEVQTRVVSVEERQQAALDAERLMDMLQGDASAG